jgi:hypothetical protein
MICTSHQILLGLSNQEEGDGEACSKYEGEERCVQGFGGETRGKEITCKTQS